MIKCLSRWSYSPCAASQCMNAKGLGGSRRRKANIKASTITRWMRQSQVEISATPYTVKPLAQKKIKALPSGPLYWRVETFPNLADAHPAVGPAGWNLA